MNVSLNLYKHRGNQHYNIHYSLVKYSTSDKFIENINLKITLSWLRRNIRNITKIKYHLVYLQPQFFGFEYFIVPIHLK